MPVAPRYFLLLGALLSGFVGGGIVGVVLFVRYRFDALLFPAVMTGLVGIAYFLFKQLQRSLKVSV